MEVISPSWGVYLGRPRGLHPAIGRATSTQMGRMASMLQARRSYNRRVQRSGYPRSRRLTLGRLVRSLGSLAPGRHFDPMRSPNRVVCGIGRCVTHFSFAYFLPSLSQLGVFFLHTRSYLWGIWKYNSGQVNQSGPSCTP